MEPSFSLKDELFNKDTVSVLVESIKPFLTNLDADAFTSKCIEGFKERELKERMTFVSECLEEVMTDDFIENTFMMLNSLSNVNANGMFVFGAYCEYVERNGCNDEFIDHSLYMLGEYTKTFSSEFAIRKFINDYPEKTFAKMLEWSLSEDTDQRRLASEGLRPKLPWSIKIDFDYREGIKPLENLFYDSERYVTRSVANHLNDISKIDPDLVVDVLKSWKKSKKQKDAEMNYVISHSCRTLIKKGHRGALELQGYKAESTFEVKDFRIEHPVISLGEYLEFSFHFKPDSDSKYMIDYIVDYPMASGKRSQKVFKIKKLNQVKDEILIKKKHQFKMMTTKTWYQGTYYIRLQINGKVIEQAAFQLNVGEH